jgi:hypothetical protein
MQTDASLVSRLSLLMPQSGVSNFVLAYARSSAMAQDPT